MKLAGFTPRLDVVDLGGSIEVRLTGGDCASELLNVGFLHADVGRLLDSCRLCKLIDACWMCSYEGAVGHWWLLDVLEQLCRSFVVP